MSELLPCPFCGGEAEHYEDGYMQHYIVCTRRGCYARSFGFEYEAEAVAAWNTRAVETCSDTWDTELTGRLRFQCSECGAVSLEITPQFCPVCGRKVER